MPIKIQITLDDKGTVQQTKVLNSNLKDTDKAAQQAGHGIGQIEASLKMLRTALAALGIGFTIQQLKDLGVGAVNTAGEFEKLRITLDTITQGKGNLWFDKINQWAIKMPITTQYAIQAFVRLNAMGLKPTIEQMEILVDTASALGGDSDTLQGIILAMGQIATKNKLMAQEIRQLAERGVPSYQILMDKLGITGEELEKMGAKAISSQTAIDALFAGMEERFGGQSKKIQETYGGILVVIKSEWQEWQRLIMDTGPFEVVKDALRGIRNQMSELNQAMRTNEEWAGFETWAKMQGYEKEAKLYHPRESGPVQYVTDYRQSVYDEYAVILERSRLGIEKATQDRQAAIDKAEADEKARLDAIKQRGVAAEYSIDLMRMGAVSRRDQLGIDLSAGLQLPQDMMRSGLGKAEQKINAEMLAAAKIRQERLRELQYQGKELEIMLTKDGWEERKAFLILQYDEEFGMIDENSELKKQATENLQNELTIIEQSAAKERLEKQREVMMRWADMWGSMLVNAATMHGNFAQNVISQFKTMMTQMAMMSASYGLVNLLGGGAGGFLGGVSNYFMSHGLTSAAAGKIAGTTYNDNSTMNVNFSAAERAVMANESDSQLAVRMRRIVRDGHLSLAGA